MGRKRSRWSCSVGPYGDTVRVYEPSLGAALRYDFRVAGDRQRPQLEPRLYVRPAPDAPVDPVAERKAREYARAKAAELHLAPLRAESEPEILTVGDAYRLYFHPRRRALPKSRSALTHHTTSRTFWQAELGTETPWDAIKPADVRGALQRLAETGMVASVEKRFHNLRTLYRWLRDDMGHDALRDPTRGIKLEQFTADYEPRRPRYTPDEKGKLLGAAGRMGNPPQRFFATLTFDSGARGGQVRLGMRSGVDRPLEPPPPEGMAPHGWLVLPGMKKQKPRLIFLTARSRAVVDELLAAMPPEWEAAWVERHEDYPLVPGGVWPFALEKVPATDRGLREWWKKLEAAAGVPTLPRRSFHGARRRWADSTRAAIGNEKTANAGGWEKTDTLTDVYLSTYQYEDIEAARVANEVGG